MNVPALFAIALLAAAAQAQDLNPAKTPPAPGLPKEKPHVHGALEAHVHGSASLDWAIESDTKSELEFHADGHSVFGFEHEPKNDAEKAAHEAGLAKLRVDLPASLALDATLVCSWKVKDVEVDYAKGHSSVEVEMSVRCKKSLNGAKLQPKVSSVFPKIETLVVRVVGSAKSALFTVVKDMGEVEFAKVR